MSIPPTPEPKLKGRFNLYNTPDGGFHIAYQEDATEENPDPQIQHIDIPGQLVRASQMMAEGKLTPGKAFSLFGSLFGGK